ncbi:MAG TPA: class I SAM-dependent methyltransferase [Myxococcota bacterium]|nr:class I SAM-dependent methyltransferase [Myxococcota bacterium]
MADSAVALTPEVDVACAVCGELAADEVASPETLAAQAELARRFHRARLTRRSRAALEERASFTQDYPTRLLACRACGLLYRSPRPAAGAVLRAYESDRYPAERLPQMIASQRALFRPKARALAAQLGRGARVLEVGSFVGGFLAEARAAGLEAIGIDPGEQAVEICRRLGLPLVRGTLENEPALADFDAVAIWNTFDQLPRPRESLAAALRVLRPGGRLLLRFPHGACFARWLRRRPLPVRALAWNNLLGFPYLHGFGLASLDSLAREFGLTRTALAGDVLGGVADRLYAPWARVEERAVKAALRARFAHDPGAAPWLDVELVSRRRARAA